MRLVCLPLRLSPFLLPFTPFTFAWELYYLYMQYILMLDILNMFCEFKGLKGKDLITVTSLSPNIGVLSIPSSLSPISFLSHWYLVTSIETLKIISKHFSSPLVLLLYSERVCGEVSCDAWIDPHLCEKVGVGRACLNAAAKPSQPSTVAHWATPTPSPRRVHFSFFQIYFQNLCWRYDIESCLKPENCSNVGIHWQLAPQYEHLGCSCFHTRLEEEKKTLQALQARSIKPEINVPHTSLPDFSPFHSLWL